MNQISEKYKEYSKSDKEKKIINTLNYLGQQKNIYKEKSRISRKKLNLFSIENGLGDIDGFVDIGNKDNAFENLLDAELYSKQILNGNFSKTSIDNKAGQRYKRQFSILENYEACLLYTSPSPRDRTRSRMPSSA